MSSSVSSHSQSLQKPGWHRHLTLGIILNAAVWGLVFSYIKLAPPKYTSQWGVKVLEVNPAVEVNLPDVGQATSSGLARPRTTHDPRTDYVYIAKNPNVIEKAAKLANVEFTDFGEAEITIDQDSGIINFVVEGKTPEEVQKKAYGLYQAIEEHVEELRATELKRQEEQTQAVLEEARQKLNNAQKDFSSYQSLSPLTSENQISTLVLNIEQLRREQAELQAQQQGLIYRSQQLSSDLGLSSPEATDAYQLLSDDLFKQQLQQYNQFETKLGNLSSRFSEQHPAVISQEAQLQATSAMMLQRASSVLGRPVTNKELGQITYLTLNDPRTAIVREELFKDLILNKAEKQKVARQNQELKKQIAQLEVRLRSIATEKSKSDTLKHDVQVTQAIFTSTLAKLDLSKDSVYSIYPPIQLVRDPNLPEIDKPTSPNPKLAFLGGLAGSFLVITGLVLLWFDGKSQSFKKATATEKVSNFNNFPPN